MDQLGNRAEHRFVGLRRDLKGLQQQPTEDRPPAFTAAIDQIPNWSTDTFAESSQLVTPAWWTGETDQIRLRRRAREKLLEPTIDPLPEAGQMIVKIEEVAIAMELAASAAFDPFIAPPPL